MQEVGTDMADQPGGPDWEQGLDGKWYAPGVLSGAGWWRANDGRWYRPEQAQRQQFAPVPPAMAYPPKRPAAPKTGWSKEYAALPVWAWTLIGGFVVFALLVGVVAAASDEPGLDEAATTTTSPPRRSEVPPTTSAPTTTEAPTPTTERATTTTTTAPRQPTTSTTQDPASGDGDEPNSGEVYQNRLDAQAEDQERLVGQAARLSGYTALVSSAGFVPSLGMFEDAGYIKLTTTIWNRDSSSQPFSLFDWRLQTPSGQVIDPAFVTAPTLSTGDLVSHGSVTGDVYFEIGSEQGTFFIIYKPDPFDAARGIWGVGAP